MPLNSRARARAGLLIPVQAVCCLPSRSTCRHPHSTPRDLHILKCLLKYQRLNAVRVIFSVVAFYFIFGKQQYSKPLLTPEFPDQVMQFEKMPKEGNLNGWCELVNTGLGIRRGETWLLLPLRKYMGPVALTWLESRIPRCEGQIQEGSSYWKGAL